MCAAEEAVAIVEVFGAGCDVVVVRESVFDVEGSGSNVLWLRGGEDAVDDVVGFTDEGEARGCVPGGVGVEDVLAAVGCGGDVLSGKAAGGGWDDVGLLVAEVVVDVPGDGAGGLEGDDEGLGFEAVEVFGLLRRR